MNDTANNAHGGGNPPVPLTDPWERRMAAHEAAHLVAAHVLGIGAGAVTACRRGAVLAGGALGVATLGTGTPENPAQANAVVDLAGAIGEAYAHGEGFRRLDYEEAARLAIEYRAARRQTVDAPPPPPDGDKAWRLPSNREHAVLSTWRHRAARGDIAHALDAIESMVADVPDVLDREAARLNAWADAQEAAAALCRREVETIRALAEDLCNQGGEMTAAQVAAFFAGRPAPERG